MIKSNYQPILLFTIIFICSCNTSKNISAYYFENKSTLDSIHQLYKEEYKKRHFSIEFTDRSFTNISIEILTDTLKYIYEFNLSESRLNDTLIKYNLSAKNIHYLISKMGLIHCTWINKLDYYVEGKKENLIFMSIRAKAFSTPFTNKKYYILTYFLQPQYYDLDGHLLDHKSRKRIRKINEEVFTRITDKVAYSISDRFR